MKNIFYALGIVSVALGLSSCEETWDKNPVLEGHEGIKEANFLNQPVLGEQTIMLTNDNSTGTFHLTASQPYYGFAAVATYRVQCSLTEDFATYREINQDFYDCAQINPINGDVAAALEYLSDVKNDADLPLPYQTLYMRLYAYIQQSQENTQYYSNVVSFKNVAANYLAIWVAGQPANLYLRGGMNGWGTSPDWQFYTGDEENSWVSPTITIEAGTEFKVADSEWGPINLGAGDNATVHVGEAYSLNGGDSPGNLTLAENFTGKAYLYLDKGNYTIILEQE